MLKHLLFWLMNDLFASFEQTFFFFWWGDGLFILLLIATWQVVSTIPNQICSEEKDLEVKHMKENMCKLLSSSELC